MSRPDTLRAVALRMREMGEGATQGKWQVGNGDTIGLDIEQTSRSSFAYGAQIAQVLDELDRESDNEGGHELGSPEADADWIAFVDPRLAGPLPDLLDAVADLIDAHPQLDHPHVDGQPCDDLACRIAHLALAVAHTLGGES